MPVENSYLEASVLSIIFVTILESGAGVYTENQRITIINTMQVRRDEKPQVYSYEKEEPQNRTRFTLPGSWKSRCIGVFRDQGN